MKQHTDWFNEPLFIITGNKSFEAIDGQEVIRSLFGENVKSVYYNQFTGNPQFNQIEKGVKLLKESKIKNVVAIGGGSVMDMAKLLIFYANTDSFTIDSSSNFDIEHSLIAVPTTAGSGSEETHFAVVYNNGIKYSKTHKSLKPKKSILIPELAWKSGKNQIIISAMDALTQAIESFWSRGGNVESRGYSKTALELLLKHFYNAIHKTDFEAFKKVVMASNYSGKAINISKTTSCHALSYYFTAKHGIPHGLAVALILPAIYQFHVDNWKDELMDELQSITGWSKENASEDIRSYLRQIGAPDTFESVGISIDEVYDEMRLTVNSERLQNNPIELNFSELKQLLK